MAYEAKSDRSWEDKETDTWEAEPEGIPGVRAQHLRKVFYSPRGPNVVAVDDVCFSAYQGQILALLGHNGAGKTTAMAILSGKMVLIFFLNK